MKTKEMKTQASKAAKAAATPRAAIQKAAAFQKPTSGKKLSKAARDERFVAAQRALAAAVNALNEPAAREAVASLREHDDKFGREANAMLSLALSLAKQKRAAPFGVLLTASGWDKHGAEAMDLARELVEAGHADALATLRELGFSLADKGYPLINSAIEHRQAAALEFAIASTDFASLDQDGYTPLGFAAHEGNLAAVERLLREPDALLYGSGFRALQECEGHSARVDAAMTEALLQVVRVDAAPYPYRSCALIELAELCDSEALGKRVAKASGWGHEKAICVAVEHGRLRFAAGICAALGENKARMRLLTGNSSAAVAFAHWRGRAAK